MEVNRVEADGKVKKSIEELCKQPVDPETYEDSWTKELPEFAKDCNYNPDAEDSQKKESD